jgi:hypothetical protein
VNGDVYEGDFVKGEFTGTGRYTRKSGGYYEGEFRNWMFHGRGRLIDDSGNTWEGTFADGRLKGIAKSTGQLGSYEGEFKDWLFHGKGKLRLANGDLYEGGFANGVYEGQGTLKYATPKPDGRKEDSGVWRYGYLPNETERKQVKTNVEPRSTRSASSSTRP